MCVKKIDVVNKETLDKEIFIIFVVLFVNFLISNLSQKQQS